MKYTAITTGIFMAGFAAVIGLNMVTRHQDSDYESFKDPAIIEGSKHLTPEVLAAANGPRTQWTKADFDAEAYGKTKAQIRAKFGKPDNVDDGSDAWYYWHLPVYDETAGIQVRNTKIRFEGIAGDADTAAEITYP